MNDAIAEIKNTSERINSRLSDTEECISNPEDRIMEITQSEQQTERQMNTKTKQHTRSMV